MKLVSILAVLLVPAPLVAQGGPAPSAPPRGPAADVERAVMGISAQDFVRRVGIIAHDSMRGRATPSPELEETAHWIAGEFQRLGLRPGGDGGTFLQGYPVSTVGVDFSASSVRATPGSVLAFGADVLPAQGSPLPGEAGGGVVVLSGASGFERAERMGLRAKHAVLVLGRELPGGARSLNQLVQTLFDEGAASILLASDASDELWAATRKALEGARYDAPGFVREGTTPLLQVRDQALERVLGPQGVDLASLRARAAGPLEAVEVPELRLDVVQKVATFEELAPNVVGILEGSDPALRGEYVVFSAHMDHVGVGRPDERGDSIYNGADDDASGTVAVIEVAEAMASLATPPRRSMIFLLVSGEEKGLWGSEHFAENPPVPIERVVANFNTDMVGRNWPDTIVAIGREHSDLGETLGRVNAAHPELGMTAIDDLWPEERFYYRSDHYNFARKGVPVLFFFNGTHEDYHRPSDSPEKIDADKAARIARLVFYLGMDVGNRTERPRWDPESYRQIVERGGGR